MDHPSDSRLREILTEYEKEQSINLLGPHRLATLRTEFFQDSVVPERRFLWETRAFNVCLVPTDLRSGVAHIPLLDASAASASQPWYHSDGMRVSKECIEYWKMRAHECVHPYLRARYSDLVWDLDRLVTGSRRPREFAGIAVDSYALAIEDGRLAPPERWGECFSRAINICSQINDQARLLNVLTRAFEMSTRLSGGLLGPSRQLEMLRISLPLLNRFAVISQVVDRVSVALQEACCQAADGDFSTAPFRIEAAEAVVKYFQSISQQKSATEFAERVARGVLESSRVCDAVSLLKVHWLEQTVALCDRAGAVAMGREISMEIQGIQSAIPGEMVSHSIELPIDKADEEEFVRSIIKESAESTLDEVACRFIPLIGEQQRLIDEIDISHPLAALFFSKASVFDDTGRKTAEINDSSDRLSHHIARNIQLSGAQMASVWKRIHVKWSNIRDVVFEYVRCSGLFVDERIAITKRAIDAVLVERESITACHLLVVEIESAIRHLCLSTGEIVQREHRNSGGYVLSTLGELLKSDAVQSVFGADAAKYLSVVLVDHAGLNLRNDICHGICSSRQLHDVTMYLLLHVLLVVGSVRPRNDERGEVGPDSEQVGQAPA
jgi:hypothetical protein